MKNIVLFVRQVLKHWIYFLTSSAPVAGVTVWEHIYGSSVKAKPFAVLSFALYTMAFYRVWLEQHLNEARLVLDLTKVHQELATERAKKLAEVAQAKLLDAQREEIEAAKVQREAIAKHEERIRVLTASDSGIRFYVRRETSRIGQTAAFTADLLASALMTSKEEIQEALLVLKSRGRAEETPFRGRWLIHP